MKRGLRPTRIGKATTRGKTCTPQGTRVFPPPRFAGLFPLLHSTNADQLRGARTFDRGAVANNRDRNLPKVRKTACAFVAAFRNRGGLSRRHAPMSLGPVRVGTAVAARRDTPHMHAVESPFPHLRPLMAYTMPEIKLGRSRLRFPGGSLSSITLTGTTRTHWTSILFKDAARRRKPLTLHGTPDLSSECGCRGSSARRRAPSSTNTELQLRVGLAPKAKRTLSSERAACTFVPWRGRRLRPTSGRLI